MAESLVTLALPGDPVLAAWASALNDSGHWAYMLDATWRYVFVTDEMRLSWGDTGSSTALPVGSHFFSTEAMRFRVAKIGAVWADRDYRRRLILRLGPRVLASTRGGREELRRVVDPELADLIDELQPEPVPLVWSGHSDWTTAGTDVAGSILAIRIDDDSGNCRGICQLLKPAAGMSQLAAASAAADLSHLERMRVVEQPDRRPAAILMADLEASSPLARHLSSAQYFAFGRRLVRAADDCIIDGGGLVGRHAGDGVVAFFLADAAGSESAAARSCITAARSLRDALADVAARSDIAESAVLLRFGLHWGATLYVGRVVTRGRSEVTALGDEMNEAARIEACATGGRTLASKPLIERLNRADAAVLGLDTGHTTYTPLAELATTTDKARRDAPSLAVCEL